MKLTNVAFQVKITAFLFVVLLFSSCEDNFMDEGFGKAQKKVSPITSDKDLIIKRRSIGFQGRAFEKRNNGSTGPMISWLKIVFTKEDGSASYTAYTNSSGSYKITLSAGRYRVVATHWNYEIYNSAPGFFVVTGTNGYQTGNFFLKKLNYGTNGGTYQRNWDNSIGPRISYVKLTFTKDDGLYSKTIYSNAYGAYKVSLPIGKYYTKAEKAGFWTYSSAPAGSVITESAGYSTLNFFQKRKFIIGPL